MSGHSKWATTKHKKAAIDAKRSSLFSKLSRNITVAAKMGGDPNPDNNASLSAAVARARMVSMPNAKIQAAIDKAFGAGADAAVYEEIVYEGYGPAGVAVYVDCLTDNKNRTAANVRSAFTKGGGNVGAQGSVSFMFDRKGQIVIDKEECDMDADELMMAALDAGAEDFSEEEDSYEVITDPDNFSAVREALEKAGIPMVEADITMIPQNWVELTDEEAIKKMQRILDLLDEDDDVQAVYHNWDE